MLFLSGLVLSGSCVLPGPEPAASEPASKELAGANQSLLLALQDAVEDGEQASAELILERLAGRELSEPELALTESFRRVLKGRSLVRDLELRLLLREEAGSRRLFMGVLSRGHEDLTLLFPPIALEYACLSLTQLGELNRNLTSQLIHPLAQLELKVGEEREILLGDCPPRLPDNALVVRDAWRANLRSGHIRTAQGSFPAERLPRPEMARDTHCASLQGEQEEPEAFVAHLSAVLAADGVGGEELLARAACLDPDRRAQLIPLLALALSEYHNPLKDKSGSRAAAIVPALRWISPSASVDSTLAAWSKWAGEWLERNEELNRSVTRSGLVLP